MDLARAAIFVGKGMFEGKREQAELARKTEANRIAAEQKQQELLMDLAKAAMKDRPEVFTELAKKIKGLEGVDLGALSSAMQDTKDKTYFGSPSLGAFVPFNHTGKDPKQAPGMNMQGLENFLATGGNYNSLRDSIFADTSGGAVKDFLSFVNGNFNLNRLNRFKTENKEASVVITEELYPSTFRLAEELRAKRKDLGGTTTDSVSAEIDLVASGKRPENSLYLRGPAVQDGHKPGNYVTLSNQQDIQDIDFFASKMGKSRDALTAELAKYSYQPSDLNASVLHLRYGSRLVRAGMMDVLNNPTQNTATVAAIQDIFTQMRDEVGEENLEDAVMGSMYMISNLLPKDPKTAIKGVAGEKVSGKDKLGAQKAEDISKRYEASNNVKILGTRLYEARARLKTSGIARTLQKGIVGVTDQFRQIQDITGWHYNQGHVRDGTTADTLLAVYRRQRGGVGETLGEIDVLEFNLAVQIARAADPSGRLSNQDFENALRTLGSGGFFTSFGESSSALLTTIDIYTKREKDMRFINTIATSENITPAQSQALDAYNLYTSIKNKIPLEKPKETSSDTPTPPEDPYKDFQPTITETIDVDGQAKTMVFSRGGQGNPPLGWYTQTPDGKLVKADANDNRLLREKRRKAKVQ